MGGIPFPLPIYAISSTYDAYYSPKQIIFGGIGGVGKGGGSIFAKIPPFLNDIMNLIWHLPFDETLIFDETAPLQRPKIREVSPLA